MSAAITGDSGRLYTDGRVLSRHPRDSRFDIFKTESTGKSFVFKRVPRWFFDRSQRIADDFPSSRRLRLHLDCNHKESVLVFDYFQDTLLDLLENHPTFSKNEGPKIMRSIAEAIRELHAKDWIHTDVKPDNVLVNWTNDSGGNKVVTDVALGDFDHASQLKENEIRLASRAVGNVMWRSPEGHSGISTRASDVYSLGLVYIYILGGRKLLLLNNNQDPGKAEQEIVTRHFCYFGPVPESLYRQTRDEKWKSVLQEASKDAETRVKERPILRLEAWGHGLGEATMDLLSGMMNLDPKARMSIDQVLCHPCWQEWAT